MGPLELKIIHTGPTARDIGWVISGFGVRLSGFEIWDRSGGSKGLSSERVKGRGNLLCDVEYGSDTPLNEGFPISSVILRSQIYTGNDFDGTISVWDGGRATFFFLAMEK